MIALTRDGREVWRVKGLRQPYSVAADASGRVNVLFTRTGAPIAEWGSCGYSDGEFQSISGITVDRMGLVYVTDYEFNRVQVFRLTGAR